MEQSTNSKRVAYLKENLLDILQGTRKTYQEYSVTYESTNDTLRHWWRKFLNTFMENGMWCANTFIEEEWLSRVLEYKDTIKTDPRAYANSIGEKNLDEKWVENIEQGLAFFDALSDKPVRSQEEAMTVVGADPTKWEVYHYESTVWSVTSFKKEGLPIHKNNYRNHIKMRLRKTTMDDVIDKMLEAIKGITPREINVVPSAGEIAVLNVADFHLGADIRNMARTLDFNIDVLIMYLHEVADKINRRQFSKVHVNMLGDFFESISGLNHQDTFKGLGLDMYGANLFILADKIFSEHFLSRINNLASINIVGGNHDRLAADKRQESTSEGAGILAYLLQKTMPSVVISYHHSILVKVIDGIQYILYHGDTGVAKQDAAKVILDYGNTDYFTCLIGAHRHTRELKKTLKTSVSTYKDITMVELDELKYRKYSIASLFTGNIFSENLGHASTAGALVTWNGGKGKPDSWDMCLS